MNIIREHPPDKKPLIFVVRFDPEGYQNLDGGKLLRALKTDEDDGGAGGGAGAAAAPNAAAPNAAGAASAPKKAPKSKAQIYTGKPITFKLLTQPYGMTINGPAASTRWVDRKGVYIVKVKPGKAADSAGVVVGMQILKVNGKVTKKAAKAECTAMIKEAMEGVSALTIEVLFDPEGYAQFDAGKLMEEYAEITPGGEDGESDGAEDGGSAAAGAAPAAPASARRPRPAGKPKAARPVSVAPVALTKFGGNRLFDGLLDESTDSAERADVNLQSQLDIVCSEKQWTAVQMFGLPAADGYYQVGFDRHVGEPVYTRKDLGLPPRKIWYNHDSNAWVISPEAGQGPVFARSPSGFARPQLVTTPWIIVEIDYRYAVGCCPVCELASTSIRRGFRATLNSSPEITIQNRQLTNLEIADLCAELRDPASRLVQLKLYKVPLTGEALHAIAEALNENVVLTHLQIRSCRIGDACVFEICNALRWTTTLEVLSLRDNGVTTYGVKALADTLVANKDCSLRMLSLGDNNVDQDGMMMLIAASRLNRSLHGVAVYGHGMTAKVAKKMWKRAGKETRCTFDSDAPIA